MTRQPAPATQQPVTFSEMPEYFIKRLICDVRQTDSNAEMTNRR